MLIDGSARTGRSEGAWFPIGVMGVLVWAWTGLRLWMEAGLHGGQFLGTAGGHFVNPFHF